MSKNKWSIGHISLFAFLLATPLAEAQTPAGIKIGPAFKTEAELSKAPLLNPQGLSAILSSVEADEGIQIYLGDYSATKALGKRVVKRAMIRLFFHSGDNTKKMKVDVELAPNKDDPNKHFVYYKSVSVDGKVEDVGSDNGDDPGTEDPANEDPNANTPKPWRVGLVEKNIQLFPAVGVVNQALPVIKQLLPQEFSQLNGAVLKKIRVRLHYRFDTQDKKRDELLAAVLEIGPDKLSSGGKLDPNAVYSTKVKNVSLEEKSQASLKKAIPAIEKKLAEFVTQPH